MDTVGQSLMNNSQQIGQIAGQLGDAMGWINAAYSLSQGKLGAAIGGAVGMYFGPIGSFIGSTLGGLVDKAFGGEMRAGGQYRSNGVDGSHFVAGPSGGEIAPMETRQQIDGTQKAINDMLKAVGSSAQLVGFQAGFETSNNNRGGVGAGGTLSTGQTFGQAMTGSVYDGTMFDPTKGFNLDPKDIGTKFTTELGQSIIEALQAAPDIPKAVTNVINSALGGQAASSLTSDATKQLLTTINTMTAEVNSFRDAAKTLPFEALKNLSFDAAAGLIAAAGGLDALKSKLSSYYDKYYTDAEKTAQATKNVADVFTGLGIAVPADMAAFRAVVENSFKDTSESGQKLSAGLLGVADAFAALHPAVAQGMAAWRELLDGLPFERLKSLGYEAASGLAAAAGGMDKLGSNLQSYYKDFYTPEEQRAQSVKNITSTLNAAGAHLTETQVGSATRGQFRAVVEDASKHLDTQAGQTLYLALLKVEGAFNELATSAEAAAQATAKVDNAFDLNQQILKLTGHSAEATAIARAKELASLDDTSRALQLRVYALEDEAQAAQQTVTDRKANLDDAKSKLMDAYNAQAGVFKDTISKFGQFADSLKKFRTSLDSGPASMLSPEAQYLASKAQFQTVSAAAQSGDEQALQDLQGVSQQYLDASKDYYASSQQYFDDLAKVKAAVSASEISARATADVAKLQLDALNNQLSALGLINTSVQSLADAISNYQSALSAYNTAVAATTKTESTSIGSTPQGLVALKGLIQDSFGRYTKTDLGVALSDTQLNLAILRTYRDAMTLHATNADIDNAMGWAAGSTAKWLVNHPEASYDIGTDYVPRDMVALVHKGERIIPAAQNRGVPLASVNADVVVELKQTNANLRNLQLSHDENLRQLGGLRKSFNDLAQTTSLRGGAPKPVAVA